MPLRIGRLDAPRVLDEDGKSAEAPATEALKGDSRTRMLTALRREATP